MRFGVSLCFILVPVLALSRSCVNSVTDFNQSNTNCEEPGKQLVLIKIMPDRCQEPKACTQSINSLNRKLSLVFISRQQAKNLGAPKELITRCLSLCNWLPKSSFKIPVQLSMFLVFVGVLQLFERPCFSILASLYHVHVNDPLERGNPRQKIIYPPKQLAKYVAPSQSSWVYRSTESFCW